MRKKHKHGSSEELMKKMADSSEHIDYGEPLNEPYQYKEEKAELITDISASTPLQEPKYAIKGTWAAPSSDTSNMEIKFEHESIDDSLDNVRPEFVELIKEMRKAKHRNEIICAEIEYKHDLYMKSTK